MFNAHDGAGIKLASIMGIRTGLITGRDSTATARRAREVENGVCDSGATQEARGVQGDPRARGRHRRRSRLCGRRSSRICRFLNALGWPWLSRDAVVEVKRAAHYITTVKGGEGAIREVVELILKSRASGRKPFRWRLPSAACDSSHDEMSRSSWLTRTNADRYCWEWARRLSSKPCWIHFGGSGPFS